MTHSRSASCSEVGERSVAIAIIAGATSDASSTSRSLTSGSGATVGSSAARNVDAVSGLL
jgi:hypothetical protein